MKAGEIREGWRNEGHELADELFARPHEAGASVVERALEVVAVGAVVVLREAACGDGTARPIRAETKQAMAVRGPHAGRRVQGKRLDFTKEDLAHIVERLRAAGYRDVVGKPKEGERVLSKELQRITGKSRRTVFRLLHDLRTGEGPEERSKVSRTMKQLAKQLSEELSTDVKFQAGPGQSGAIVVKFSSHKQRGELLRYMNLER